MSDLPTSAHRDEPADPEDPDALVARALAALEQGGRGALEELLARHPAHAALARERVARLEDLGLVALGGESRADEPPRFGHYRLLERLGAGGMGVVYLARDERLGRLVALETLAGALRASPRSRQRFAREARAVAALEHEHLVPIFEVGEVDGQPFFTMPNVRGRTLAAWIALVRGRVPSADELERRPLTELLGPDAPAALCAEKSWSQLAARLVEEIASALHHAHERGIVHRDVKPANVLVDDSGAARLFDFGLAMSADAERLTHSAELAGTPYYASPEQVAGRAEVARSTDVYSAGVTLFELLTLRPPFTGASTVAVLARILGEDTPSPRRFNPLVPRDLETICLRATEKDPRARYADAGAFADDLHRFRAGRPVAARPIGRALRALRRVRRHKALAAASALTARILFGVPTGLALSNRRIGRERDRAEAAAAVLDVLLIQADPQYLGPASPFLDVLDAALATMAEGLAAHPDLEARLLTRMGALYKDVGRVPDAVRPLERAIELLEARHGPLHADSAEPKQFLAMIYEELGRPERAAALAREVRDIVRAHLPAHAQRALEAEYNLAMIAARAGELDLAQTLLEAAHAAALAGPPQPDQVAHITLGLGLVAEQRGELALALALARFETARELFGQADDPGLRGTAEVLGHLARSAYVSGDVVRAIASYEAQVALLREQTGNAGWLLGGALLGLGQSLERELARAERACAEGLELVTADLGQDHTLAHQGRVLLRRVRAAIGTGESAEPR